MSSKWSTLSKGGLWSPWAERRGGRCVAIQVDNHLLLTNCLKRVLVQYSIYPHKKTRWTFLQKWCSGQRRRGKPGRLGPEKLLRVFRLERWSSTFQQLPTRYLDIYKALTRPYYASCVWKGISDQLFPLLGRDHFQASCLSRSWCGIQIGGGWHQVHQNQGDFPSGNWPWLSSNQNQGDVVTSPLKIFLFSDSDLIGFVCLLYNNLWQVEASIDHLSQYLVLRLGSDLGLVPDNIDGDEVFQFFRLFCFVYYLYWPVPININDDEVNCLL